MEGAVQELQEAMVRGELDCRQRQALEKECSEGQANGDAPSSGTESRSIIILGWDHDPNGKPSRLKSDVGRPVWDRSWVPGEGSRVPRWPYHDTSCHAEGVSRSPTDAGTLYKGLQRGTCVERAQRGEQWRGVTWLWGLAEAERALHSALLDEEARLRKECDCQTLASV